MLVRASIATVRACPQLYPGIGQAVASCWSPVSEWLLPCQQERSSGRGQKISHASKMVLCYTPHTILPVYTKPIFCFPLQKEHCQSLEAVVFIETCISKLDMRSAASGAAEKQSVNTLERASQQGWRGTSQPESLPKSTRGGKVKLRLNKPSPSTLFSIWWGHPTHKSTSSYVKAEALFYYFFNSHSFPVWRTAVSVSP